METGMPTESETFLMEDESQYSSCQKDVETKGGED